jgi:rhodanese-related sulfurtransferase
MSEKHSEDFLRLANTAKERIKQVKPAEAATLVGSGALLLDVREQDEFAQGHLANASHLSRGSLEMKIHEIAQEKSQPIICYCSGGNRGALAANTLQQMGYTQVFSIEGGLDACRAAGQPVSPPP